MPIAAANSPDRSRMAQQNALCRWRRIYRVVDHAGRKSVPFHVVTPRPPLSASLEPCLNGLFWDKFWGTWLLAFFISLVAVVVAFFTMALWLPHSWYRALLYPG